MPSYLGGGGSGKISVFINCLTNDPVEVRSLPLQQGQSQKVAALNTLNNNEYPGRDHTVGCWNQEDMPSCLGGGESGQSSVFQTVD